MTHWDDISPGTVVFGSRISDSGLEVVVPRDTFGPLDEFAWMAHFGEMAGTTLLRETYVRLDPDGSERLIWSHHFGMDPASDFVSDQTLTSVIAAYGILPPAVYQLRYYRDRDSRQLAQGTFTLFGQPSCGTILFGSGIDNDRGLLKIIQPKVIFSPAEPIAWVALFNCPSEEGQIRMYCSREGESTNAFVESSDVPAGFTQKGYTVPPRTLAALHRGGTYEVQYFQNSTKLAAGTFMTIP